MDIRMPAEWEPQSGIMLAWPHKDTDWNYMLTEVQECFKHIAEAIVEDETLILIAPDVAQVKMQLAHLDQSQIKYYEIPTNDTWARDFGAISVIENGCPKLIDFKFNAWGLKFAANFDNLINHSLAKMNTFSCNLKNRLNFVLEGGSIESDGAGCILTTENCLLSPNRNGEFTKDDIEQVLRSELGAEKVLWLSSGELEGDDTDSHIDTLARFAPCNTILYVSCDDKSDCHYQSLKRMETELMAMSNINGEKFNLKKLPLPDAIFDEDGLRLPATYANFLIMNHQVLVPIYNQPKNDDKALTVIGEAFPKHKIVGIDCNALIKQHGSLHCLTMQFSKNMINL